MDKEIERRAEDPNAPDDESYCGSAISTIIFVLSVIMIILTFPFSLCVCMKMVQVRIFREMFLSN